MIRSLIQDVSSNVEMASVCGRGWVEVPAEAAHATRFKNSHTTPPAQRKLRAFRGRCLCSERRYKGAYRHPCGSQRTTRVHQYDEYNSSINSFELPLAVGILQQRYVGLLWFCICEEIATAKEHHTQDKAVETMYPHILYLQRVYKYLSLLIINTVGAIDLLYNCTDHTRRTSTFRLLRQKDTRKYIPLLVGTPEHVLRFVTTRCRHNNRHQSHKVQDNEAREGWVLKQSVIGRALPVISPCVRALCTAASTWYRVSTDPYILAT